MNFDPTKTDYTQQELRDMENYVLFPETHTKKISLAGTEYTLRPLPLGASKKLASLAQPYLKTLERMMMDTSKATDEDAQAFPRLATEAALFLVQFHKINTDATLPWMEENLSLNEIINLVGYQCTLNDENDFFLQPLRTVMLAMRGAAEKMQKNLSQSLLKEFASVGTSVSTNSSPITPSVS